MCGNCPRKMEEWYFSATKMSVLPTCGPPDFRLDKLTTQFADSKGRERPLGSSGLVRDRNLPVEAGQPPYSETPSPRDRVERLEKKEVKTEARVEVD